MTDTAPVKSDGIEINTYHQNLGFGKANNQAAQKAQGQYLYCLNPDATLIEPDALKKCYAFMQQHLDCGLAGTQVIHQQSGKTIQAAYHYPKQKHLKYTAFNLPGEIAWVQGSSMIISRSLFSHLGSFDPDYFLYAEEIDLCLRVRKAGYRIGLCHDVQVLHIGGASQSKQSITATRLKKQQALYLFYQKHYDIRDYHYLAKRAKASSRFKMFFLKSLAYLSVNYRESYLRQQVIYQTAQTYLSSYVKSHRY